ncbi:MAG: HEAT repeat-containing protein [Candidatus Kentron sp. G]|nr:MAG: HEAT repeat-containing protein [Candidatus Kentron sp. G]
MWDATPEITRAVTLREHLEDAGEGSGLREDLVIALMGRKAFDIPAVYGGMLSILETLFLERGEFTPSSPIDLSSWQESLAPHLLANLSEAEQPDPKQRYRAARALAWTRDSRHVPELIRLVRDDPDPTVRRVSAYSLLENFSVYLSLHPDPLLPLTDVPDLDTPEVFALLSLGLGTGIQETVLPVLVRMTENLGSVLGKEWEIPEVYSQERSPVQYLSDRLQKLDTEAVHPLLAALFQLEDTTILGALIPTIGQSNIQAFMLRPALFGKD